MLFSRLLTAVFCLFVALPLLWLLYAAFLPPEAVFFASLRPTGFSLANFADLAGTGIWRAMGVSLVATGLTVLGQLVFGLGAAYAIRSGFPLLGLVLFVLVLPLELLLVPLYRQLQALGLLDTLWVLVLPFLASPLVIFLLSQSLKRLPWELVEAARLDGAGELTIVARIVAPLLRPELAATAVLAFAAHWNLVLYPRVMAGDRELWTVQVFLTELLRNRPLDWGLLGAAAFVTTLPIFILYIIFEKRIVAVFESSFR
ncbi:carbohydrate ABC transporter permease [soil metagenome]|jgi:multiple sugar transport system permease protein|nr:carbohydrate ABC transporter permease [Deinococcota bacterium]